MDFAGKTKTLAICHFVMAGLNLLGLPLIQLHRYTMTHLAEFTGDDQTMPTQQLEIIMPVMEVMYGIITATIVLAVTFNILAGIGLLTHKWKILVAIVAGGNCLSIPLGTLLGVFTFITVFSDEGRRAFSKSTPKQDCHS